MEPSAMKAKLSFVAIAVLSLCGFSCQLKIAVVNNTGDQAAVTSGKDVLSTPPGGLARFVYPTVAQQRRFQASFGGCTFTYRMPDTIEGYAMLDAFDGVVVAQMESDASLYLIPPTATGPVTLAEAASLQKEGFPVTPVEKRCH